MANTKFLDESGLQTLVRQIKSTFTRLDGSEPVTGQQIFNEGIVIPLDKNGIKRDTYASPTEVWTTDGKTMDLSDYAALIADKYPFGISSFSSNKPSVIEVSTTLISPILTWNYKNEKHTITEQKVTSGATTKTVPVGTKTITWDPIDISSHKTVSFTLTAKADEGIKTDSKTTSIITVHKRYSGALNTTDAPTFFAGLTAISTLQNSAYGDITVTTNNQHPCYLYPKYMKPATLKIYDQNNFDVTGDFLEKETTIDGVDYICRILKNSNTLTGFIYHFKNN